MTDFGPILAFAVALGISFLPRLMLRGTRTVLHSALVRNNPQFLQATRIYRTGLAVWGATTVLLLIVTVYLLGRTPAVFRSDIYTALVTGLGMAPASLLRGLFGLRYNAYPLSGSAQGDLLYAYAPERGDVRKASVLQAALGGLFMVLAGGYAISALLR